VPYGPLHLMIWCI